MREKVCIYAYSVDHSNLGASTRALVPKQVRVLQKDRR